MRQSASTPTNSTGRTSSLADLIPLPATDFGVRFRERLHDGRFWLVQAMICAVTVGHAVGESLEKATGIDLGAAYFIPASLYFFPVLFASLNFGREGAIPTAIWSGLLAIPNIFIWHHGLERVGEAFQMSLIILLAWVVASRVDKEIIARTQAEEFERRRRVSETKYQALFQAAGEACLVFDTGGTILDANAAAGALLGKSIDEIRGTPLVGALNGQGALLLSPQHQSVEMGPELSLYRPDGSEAWIQPICTSVPTDEGDVLVQAWLKDVTERRRLQFYTQEIVRAQEEERQRVAQDLHDVSVQSAVLLCRRLDAVTEAAETELAPQVVSALVEARKAAEGISDELRRFSRDLRPLILDDLGLTPAIKRLVAELSDRSPIQARLTVSGASRRVDPGAELALFRIAQEALRNAERHSGASRVTVKLAYGGGDVRLGVTDDGKGFSVPSYTTLAGAGRLGLLGMHERARLAGGSCTIESQPGKGTRVEAHVPASGGTNGSRRDDHKKLGPPATL